ncbi:MAG: putative molybdenum carrier protein, partial [Pseudomonadota bacterium]|nr:putative molybdenum carrier protein [Pseudomonadota bacterium]
GGQTGVDRAALDVAMARGISCGGWCPKGREAEDGALPEHYPLTETASKSHEERTGYNVRDADGTLIIVRGILAGGTAVTLMMTDRHQKPCHILQADKPDMEELRGWIIEQRIRILNVAGPRESESPGIYRLAHDILEQLFAGTGSPPARG